MISAARATSAGNSLSTVVDILATVFYSMQMREIIASDLFSKWLNSLQDRNARSRIIQRLDRLQAGNAGDTKPIGEGLSELRINYGPGYRVYYMQRGPIIAILLCGGDKRDQTRDIARAKEIARAWRDD